MCLDVCVVQRCVVRLLVCVRDRVCDLCVCVFACVCAFVFVCCICVCNVLCY